jgi:hypothetical protein
MTSVEIQGPHISTAFKYIEQSKQEQPSNIGKRKTVAKQELPNTASCILFAGCSIWAVCGYYFLSS